MLLFLGMRLILVRHGITPWNEQRRVQGGNSDIELSEKGREQAYKVASALKGEEIKAIYSSPLKRALETAKSIAELHNLKVIEEPALREIDAGEADGLSVEELSQLYPQFWKEWREGEGSIRWPGGESLEEVGERAWGLVERLKVRHNKDTIVLVSHTFVLSVLILKALGIDLGSFRRLRIEVGSISILDLDGERASLVKLNDTCHLR